MTVATATLIEMANRRKVSLEEEWDAMVASLRVEDGRRFVLDNELDLHDSYLSGQFSMTEIRDLARRHFAELIAVTGGESDAVG